MKTTLVLLSLFLAVGIASAGDIPAECRIHFKKGSAAFQTGDFQRSIDEYKAAYEQCPLPLLLWDLGQAYRAIGSNELARHEYKQYLEETRDGTPDGRFRADATKAVAELEELLAREHKTQTAPPNGVAPPDEKPSQHEPVPPAATAPAIPQAA